MLSISHACDGSPCRTWPPLTGGTRNSAAIAVSCDAVNAGVDSGDPTRTGGVRDASPGQLAMTRSVEENEKKRNGLRLEILDLKA